MLRFSQTLIKIGQFLFQVLPKQLMKGFVTSFADSLIDLFRFLVLTPNLRMSSCITAISTLQSLAISGAPQEAGSPPAPSPSLCHSLAAILLLKATSFPFRPRGALPASREPTSLSFQWSAELRTGCKRHHCTPPKKLHYLNPHLNMVS